jgi:hypothetical protein
MDYEEFASDLPPHRTEMSHFPWIRSTCLSFSPPASTAKSIAEWGEPETQTVASGKGPDCPTSADGEHVWRTGVLGQKPLPFLGPRGTVRCASCNPRDSRPEES